MSERCECLLMDFIATVVRWDYSLLPLGATIVLFLCWRGYLHPQVLKGIAHQRAKLHPEDLLFGIVLMLFGRILTGLVAAALWPEALANGRETSELAADEYGRLVLLSQAGQLPLLIFLIWRLGRQREGLRTFGLWTIRPFYDLGVGVLILLISLPVVLSVGVLCTIGSSVIGHPAPPVGHEMLLKVQQADSWSAIGKMVVCAVLIAPILEEILYRGLVQTVLVNLGVFRNRWLVVLTAAAVFALVHLGPQVAWQGLPVLFVLGIFLGCLYERTGSLWPGVVLHAGFNAINCVLAWISPTIL